jgi:arginase
MQSRIIIPCPYALSPYAYTADNGRDLTYKKILGVSAANDNMQEQFPSNLLVEYCDIAPEIQFQVLPDKDPEGLYLDSAQLMQHSLAEQVKISLTNSQKILVLGGDHTISIGTGLGISQKIDMSRVGLLYIDAHADCNIPATSASKSITGYPVAINCGVGPSKLTEEFNTTLENVAYIGLRDVDRGELANIQHINPIVYSNIDIERLGIAQILETILEKWKNLDYIWLSIDIDSLDPIYFEAHETDVPVTGGLTPRELLYITSTVESTNKLLVTELVQLNNTSNNTPLTVLASRISELSLGLGKFRYGIG